MDSVGLQSCPILFPKVLGKEEDLRSKTHYSGKTQVEPFGNFLPNKKSIFG